jgi:rare lipoprotein A
MIRSLFGAAIFAVLAFPFFAVAQTGVASYYGGGETLNRHTANGEVFKPGSATCAHRRLPFGTMVRITNLKNGKSAHCRINDRGPAALTGRLIDVSKGIASMLGMIKAGTAKVTIKVLTKKNKSAAAK